MSRNQRSNCQHPRIIEKAREFPKTKPSFCFIDYAKAFDCVDHNKLGNILKETGIPDHLTCLLRNLYAGQEATVRTRHGTTDWFQKGKGVCQGCILSPCLFNLYEEYIMKNAGMEDTWAGIKIAGRNINKLRYADDITTMAESEEEQVCRGTSWVAARVWRTLSKFQRLGVVCLEMPQWKWASLRLEGRISWIFSSCGRCSRVTTGSTEIRSGGLRKGQSPGELLGGI